MRETGRTVAICGPPSATSKHSSNIKITEQTWELPSDKAASQGFKRPDQFNEISCLYLPHTHTHKIIYPHLLISPISIIYYSNSLSTLSKLSKNPLNTFTPNPGSSAPVVARILYILSYGIPASIALTPIVELSIGPTVPPLRESFLIINS